jgi:hypothetical protein
MIKKLLNKIVFISILSTFAGAVFGKVDYKNQLGLSMGMLSNSFAQQASAFDSNKAIESGSGSVIAFDISYEMFTLRRRSYYFRFTGSGIAGEVSKYYSLSGGQRFYFGADGTSAVFDDAAVKITTHPVLRYYAGWNAGVFSIVYEPGDEVRGDVGVEFGGHGGLLFAIDKKTSYKVEMSALKGTGVETTSFNIQILFGTSYFVHSLF